MKRVVYLVISMVACLILSQCTQKYEPDGQIDWSIGTAGGVYLMAEPGELVIEVFKQDQNLRAARNDLRAILLSPDRKIVEDVVIPHSGGAAGDPPGVVTSAVIRTKVEHPGIYALNITMRNDRYGLNTAWGIKTNARSWVVETANGHRDERHVEPIVLLDTSKPSDIHFLPREGEFLIEAEGLSRDVEKLSLYNEKDELVADIPVQGEKISKIRQYLREGFSSESEGSVTFQVPADPARGKKPWRLHVPHGPAYVNIDGITRWESTDLYPDLCVWTPVKASWFPLLEYRWMISPYQRTVWAQPGSGGEISFLVHNNSPWTKNINLKLDFPAEKWQAELSEKSVLLDPGQSREISVSYTAPPEGEQLECLVRATPAEDRGLTTYASLTVKGGEAPAARPLEFPIVLQPYSHENRLFGYLPGYPVENEMYFDLNNEPYVAANDKLYRKVDGAWTSTEITGAVVRKVPDFPSESWSLLTTKVAFDSGNDLYLIGSTGNTVALLHSSDQGKTFTAYQIPGRENERRSWNFETFTGHNIPDGPPPVVRLTLTYPLEGRDPKLTFRRVNDLELITGEKADDGTITLGDPVMVTRSAIVTGTTVTNGSNVHIVWGEATDPEISREQIPGVPSYVATFDRETGKLGKPVFLAYGVPVNDGHNTPSITMDSKGFLHVLIGTHGRPFQYMKSKAPDDAYAGWSEPVRTSQEDLRQTYIAFVCDQNDALHLAYRLWRSGKEYLADVHHLNTTWASLAYQKKPDGMDWEEPRILIVPPMTEYSIYHHRLTTDRKGDLFLSYDYWSTMWFYRNDQRGPSVSAGSGRPGRGWGRAVMTSPDGGKTWKFL